MDDWRIFTYFQGGHPIKFAVYGGPKTCTVTNIQGAALRFSYAGDMNEAEAATSAFFAGMEQGKIAGEQELVYKLRKLLGLIDK